MFYQNVGVTWIASKFAPCCFNISYGYGSINIRDQVVRAQLLVSDLESIYKNDCRNITILIVGAGFAGTTAAVVADKCGFKVCLVDSQDGLLSLQKKVQHRYVGAFMYDWPCEESYSQHYPPKIIFGDVDPEKIPTPQWESFGPTTAAVLAEKHAEWFKKCAPSLKPHYSVDPESVKKYMIDFVDWNRDILHKKRPTSINYINGDSFEIEADLIVFAGGMGRENTKINCKDGKSIQSENFWGADDGFRKNRELTGNSLVIGGGDGALQDVLRIITRHDDILSIIKSMEFNSIIGDAINKLKPVLRSIQLQTILADSHNLMDAHKKSDECIEQMAENVFNYNVDGFLRWGRENIRECVINKSVTVHHVIKSDSFGKSYLVNKFLVHLVNLITNRGYFPVKYKLHKNIDTESDLGVDFSGVDSCLKEGKNIYSMEIGCDKLYEEFEFISVRIGLLGSSDGVYKSIGKYYSDEFDFNPIKALGSVHLPRVLY